MKDIISANDQVGASTSYNTQPNDSMAIEGHYHAVCYDANGNIKWEEDIHNVVTDLGRNLTLDTIFGNTAAGAVYMGLKGTGTAIAANTQAAHATWLEVGLANAPTYSGTRKSPTFSVATSSTSISTKTTSAAVSFAITSTGTVAGCFINIGGSATIDNTSNTLFSAGDFSSPKSVVNLDTIAVTYTATLQ